MRASPRTRIAVYATALALLTTPLLLFLGCGGVSPGSTPSLQDPSQPAPPSRLVRESDGLLHDRALAGTVCAFATETGTCKSKCFPIEPLFKACGGDGQEYWFTKQYLLTKFSYGAILTRTDVDCGGANTYQLVKLVPNKPETAHDCADVRFDLGPSLNDRNWYFARPSPYPAASEDDLPAR